MFSRFGIIKREYTSYSGRERIFFLLAMLCHFFLMIEVSIVKPSINSIFLTHCSSKLYPYAWLLSVPLNFSIVLLYNHFLKRFSCFSLFVFISFFILLGNSLAAIWVPTFSFLSFFLYIWKDIYILLMFHQLWAVIHANTTEKRAKYLYGFFFGIGSLGGAFGSLLTTFLVGSWGSEALLFLTTPIYILLGIIYYFMLKKSTIDLHKSPIKNSSSNKSCWQQVVTSSPLRFILLMVLFMQLSVTLLDFHFNSFLEWEIPDQDKRTQFCAKLWFFVENGVFIFQFLATFLLIQFIGIEKSKFFLPLVLLLNTSLCFLFPSFLLLAYTFGVAKTFDYSLFHILKEMLYVPLTREEKFTARAVIDIFAYRLSKAFASLAIIGMQYLFPSSFSNVLLWIIGLLYLAWLFHVSLSRRRMWQFSKAE